MRIISSIVTFTLFAAAQAVSAQNSLSPKRDGADSVTVEKLKSENFMLKLQVRELKSKLSAAQSRFDSGISSLDAETAPKAEEDFYSIVDRWDTLTENENIADDTEAKGLNAIDSIIRIDDDKTVLKYIDVYTVRRKNSMMRAFLRFDQYRDMIAGTFTRHGVPVELSALCIVESAASNKAISHAGAVGLWQLMPATAIQYGLEVSLFTDDRYNAEKSTEAAARYLADKYRKYKDWRYVLLSYNCGPGRLDKAISDAGKDAAYEDIVKRLPRETRDYVPAFLAAQYVNANRELLIAH